MTRVVYYISTPLHKRVFASLKDRPDMEQVIVAPDIEDCIGIPFKYDEFGIDNIKTYPQANIKVAQSIVNNLAPDILVQSELKENIKVSGKCKRVFVNHGIMNKATNDFIKREEMAGERKFDVYCGLTSKFKDFIDHTVGPDNNIQLNILPQLDLLNNYYAEAYKEQFLKQVGFSPDLVVLFLSRGCKDRSYYIGHNEDYFETIFELDHIAKKNNWLVIVKTKQTTEKIIKFVSKMGSRLNKYAERYKKMVNSNPKHMVFVDHISNTYRYYFADAVLLNGFSSVEMESVIMNKPSVSVRVNPNKKQLFYDPFGTISSGAIGCVNSINNLYDSIFNTINGNSYIEKQQKLLNKINIEADGDHHKRLQDILALL